MIGYSTDLKEIRSSVIKEYAEDLIIENYAPYNGKDSQGKGFRFVKETY